MPATVAAEPGRLISEGANSMPTTLLSEAFHVSLCSALHQHALPVNARSKDGPSCCISWLVSASLATPYTLVSSMVPLHLPQTPSS